jgi:hypothetical protein
MALAFDVNILVVEAVHKTAPKASRTGFAFEGTLFVLDTALKYDLNSFFPVSFDNHCLCSSRTTCPAAKIGRKSASVK